ncbi:MAG TPA: hypothetical protein VGF69_05750, partial [Thermoanaerobaculia bacterium]
MAQAPRRLNAARHELNVLDRRPAYYAFVYEITEGCDDAGRWIVDMELLDKRWFDRVWRELSAKTGGDRIAAYFGSGNFDELYPDMPFDLRQTMFDIHMAYLYREIDEADPAPVALLQVVLAPTDREREELMIARWYQIELGPPRAFAAAPSYDEVAERVAVFSELAREYEKDPPPVDRDLITLVPPRPPVEALLKALHLPQGNPSLEDDGLLKPGPVPSGTGGRGGGMPVQGGEEHLPGAAPAALVRPPIAARVRSELARLFQAAKQRLGTAAAKVAEWLGTFPWSGPPGVTAEGFTMPLPEESTHPARAGEERELHAPLQYVGGPTAMGVQVPNPMIPGGGPYQPFVGVLNIGQGNCCALYDNTGHVLAYFDFGLPSNMKLGTFPPVLHPPCVHDDPLIMISHWDWDHVSMARRQHYALDCRWVAPQQHLGPATSREIYARVVASVRGGLLYLWPATGAPPVPVRHVATPWGFLERGTRHNQADPGSSVLNEGGLMHYVCVGDAPGAAAAGGVLPIAAPFNGRAGGPVPTAVPARAAAMVTQGLMSPVEVQWPKIAEAAAVAVGELAWAGGVAAPAANDVADAAEMAVRHAAGGGGAGWLAILMAIGAAPVAPAIAAGAITAGANALAGALGGQAAQPDCGAAITAAEAAVGGSITGLAGAFTVPDVVAAAGIADALAAELAAGPGGSTVALLTNTARGSAAAMAAAFVVIMPVPPVGPAVLLGTAAAARATLLGTAIRLAANATAAAAAEIASAAVVAAVIPAAQCVAAAGAGVRTALGGGGWPAVLATLAAPAPGCALISAAAGPLNWLLAAAPGPPGSAGAAVDDRVQNFAGSVNALVLNPPSLEDLAAAAAVADAAVAAAAGLPAAQVTSAGREAAREVGDAAGVHLRYVPAPIPAAVLAVGGAAGAPGGSIAIAGGALVVADAPFHAGEHYVMLPGDASTYFTPSTRHPHLLGAAPHAPAVVGYLPAHHGAVTVFGGTQTAVTAAALNERATAKARLPWAPGTPAAAAGAAVSHAMAPPFAGVPETVCKATAAAAAMWGAEVAVLWQRYKPAALLLAPELGPLGAHAAVTAYPGGVGWLNVLQALAWPAAGYDAGRLTDCASRLLPVLGAVGGAPGTAAAAVAGVAGWAPVTGIPNLAELTAAAAAADAAVAGLAVGWFAAAAALGAYP